MSMRQIYGFVVFRCGVAPDYFFDKMTEAELEALSESYFESYKDSWEKVRTISHTVMSSQSSKPIKATDVLKFAWDSEKSTSRKTLSDEDRERLMKKINS